MAIVEIEIDAIEPFAEGRAFGDVGSYLRSRGIAKGEIDPRYRRTALLLISIKGRETRTGWSKYEADFFILRPAEPHRANSVLVYDVTNRGRKMILSLLDDAASPPSASGLSASCDPKTGGWYHLGSTR